MAIDTILMIGKTGSGKETQAKLLSERLGFRVFSSGERFREIKSKDTPLGNRIRQNIDRGHLMPHWLSTFIFQEELFNLKADEGIIFEGTGRKLPEAEMFDEVATWLERQYFCIHLAVPDEEVMKRQLKRDREDSNTPEKVKTRLDEYYQYTTAVIDFFRLKDKVVEIDGVGDQETIHGNIVEALHARRLTAE